MVKPVPAAMPTLRPSRVLERDKGRGAEPDRQRKQAGAGKHGRRRYSAGTAFAVERDLMKQGRRDEKADANQVRHEPRTMNDAAGGRDFRKQLLKHRLELKSEQDLCSQNQQAGFVERSLQSAIDRHPSTAEPSIGN